MTTIVIVPFRPDYGHRDRLWEWVRGNYWKHLPWPIELGHHDKGAFNRAAAVNSAADRQWDYAIIADSDTWVPAKQLMAAVSATQATGRLVAAFDAVVELSQPCTDNILRGQTTISGSFEAGKIRTRELETQSSMLVVPRTLWDRAGGMDERFAGWGCEDNAFWRACSINSGEPQRLSGNAYHLWHAPASGKFNGSEYRRNLELWRRYERCMTVEQLRSVQCGQA